MGKANLIPTRIRSAEAKTVEVEIFDHMIRISDEEGAFAENQSALCMIRPESIRFDKAGTFPATVERRTYLGAQTEYDILIGQSKLTMVDHQMEEHPVGAHVSVSFNQETLRVLQK